MATATTTSMTYRCPHCNRPVQVELRPDSDMVVCPIEDCHKPFRIDVPRAEPLPDAATRPAGAPVAEVAGAVAGATTPAVATPVVAPTAADAPETTLQTVRLSMFRRYPFRVLGYVLLIVAALVGVILSIVHDNLFVLVLSAAAGAFVLYRLLAWWVRMQNSRLMLTSKRVIIETGVFTTQTTEMPVTDVDDIQIHQTWLQRVLDVGDLTLLSKKGETQRFIIMAVPSPRAVAERLRDARPQPPPQ